MYEELDAWERMRCALPGCERTRRGSQLCNFHMYYTESKCNNVLSYCTREGLVPFYGRCEEHWYLADRFDLLERAMVDDVQKVIDGKGRNLYQDRDTGLIRIPKVVHRGNRVGYEIVWTYTDEVATVGFDLPGIISTPDPRCKICGARWPGDADEKICPATECQAAYAENERQKYRRIEIKRQATEHRLKRAGARINSRFKEQMNEYVS